MSKMKTLTLDNGEKRETFNIDGIETIKLHLEDGKVNFAKLITDEEQGNYSINRFYELNSNTPIQFIGVKNGHGSEEPSVLYETTATKLFVLVTAYCDGNVYIKCTVLSTTERHQGTVFKSNGLVQIEHWIDNGLGNYHVSNVYEYATKEETVIKLHLENGEFRIMDMLVEEWSEKGHDFSVDRIYELTTGTNEIKFMHNCTIGNNKETFKFDSIGTTLVRVSGEVGGNFTIKCTILSSYKRSRSADDTKDILKQLPLVQVNYYLYMGTGQIFTDVLEYATKESLADISVNAEYSLHPITLADVELNKICPLGAYAYPGTSIEQLDNACSYDSNYCVLKHEVKKGDLVIFTNAHQMSGTEQKIAVMGKDGMLADVRAWSGMDSPSRHAAIWSTFASYYYEVPCDGTIYMSFVYTDVHAGEFFYIKTAHPSEPIVLYEYVDYSENSTMGDKVFKALMEGKNVLVRVENADGGNYTAIYSPIYQYQVPNKLNNYLYLYYLKDTKQTLDLSAVGIGTIQLPIYEQIKLKVSHTYNHTPLV